MHHGLCRRDLDQSRTSKPNQWKSQLDSLIMLVDCKHFATGSCRLLTSELGKVALVRFKKIGLMDFDFYRAYDWAWDQNSISPGCYENLSMLLYLKYSLSIGSDLPRTTRRFYLNYSLPIRNGISHSAFNI